MSDDAQNEETAASVKSRRRRKAAAEKARASLRLSGRPHAPRGPGRRPAEAVPPRPYDKLVAMRRELYRVTPAGVDGLSAQEVLQRDYDEIARGEHVLSWPGTAVALMLAYRRAGFQAWAYEFGLANDLPAAVTIVEINGRRLIQDAYLNEECDLDLLEVLDRLRGDRKPPWRWERSDRKRSVDGTDVGAAEYRKRILAAGAKASFPRLQKLGLAEDHHVLMLSPQALFDGDATYTDPASMPLIKEWIERRGGVPLGDTATRRGPRGMAQPPAETSMPAQASEAFEASSQKLTQERRQWLAERLILQERLDTAEYQATLADARQRATSARIQQLSAEAARSAAELASSDEVCARNVEQIENLEARIIALGAQLDSANATVGQAATEAAARETALQQLLNEARAAADQAASEAIAREAVLQQMLREADAAAGVAATEAAAREAALQQLLIETGVAASQTAAEAAAREAVLQQTLDEAGVAANQAAAEAAGREATLQEQVVQLAHALAEVTARRREAEASLEASQGELKRVVEENEQLAELARQTAAELATVIPREHGEPATQAAGELASRALWDARKAAGVVQASLVRERLLQNDNKRLEEERESLHGEVVHLSAVVNRSRYLRWRRRLAQWLTGRR